MTNHDLPDEEVKALAAPLDLLRAVEEFLYTEADHMDRHEYDEWLALWDEQATYWVPCNEEDVDPRKKISLIYETRKDIEDRLFRLKGRHAHAQSPKSRLVRVVSNIRVESVMDEMVTVQSRFILGEVRLNRQAILLGRVTHKLVPKGGSFLIREKKVFLIENDTPMANVTYLV